MNNHAIGSRVVCISSFVNDETKRFIEQCPFEVTLPEVGKTYVVRDAGVGRRGDAWVHLEEIVHPRFERADFVMACYAYGLPPEIAFSSAGFRPVRETDISIFTAMLKGAPADEKTKEKVDV